jgi:hypothetical protein
MKIIYDYSLLQEITKHFELKKSSFEKVYILACQHILEPQLKMFQLLSDFGIPKQNIQIFGKIYSTSNEVLEELSVDGFNVSQPFFDPSVTFDIQHEKNCKNEFDKFISSVPSSSKIIILDDGGELLKVVNEEFNAIPQDTSVIGIEQTSSGFRKLEHSQVNFPIFNVARSVVKLIKESPLIANLGFNRMIDVFKQYSIVDPRILIVGLGPIGSSMLSVFNQKEYFTLGYDIAHHDKSELIDLIKNNNVNVVVGITGSNILNEIQLQEIKDGLSNKLFFVSMSSADREFPAVYMRENGTVSAEIHGDVVWENLILINNGFPITFKGNRYESTPQEIERTIGLLYGSTLEAITNSEIKQLGFIDVPESVNDILEKHE